MIGILLSDDLIFASRITGTAQDLGFTITAARSSTALLNLPGRDGARCVIVDLANPGLDIVDLVQQLKSATHPPFIVAYGSHVDAASLRNAREAGCDVVWPRSKFAEELATALPAWFADR